MSLKNRPTFGTVTLRTRQDWAAHARVALVLVASSLSGCTGKPAAMPAAPADATREAPIDVTEIQKLFDQNCVSCHLAGSGLDLTDGQSYANLVGHPAPASESCGGVLVVPGSPDTSYLYLKLSNPHPCVGLQMPRTDIYSIPLPQCLQQLVRDWITAGASPEGNVSDAGSMTDSASDSGGQ